MKKIKHKTKKVFGYIIEEINEGRDAHVLIDNTMKVMGMNTIKRWYDIVEVEIVEKGETKYITNEPKVYGKPDTLKEYSDFGYKVREFLENYKSKINGGIKDNKKHSVLQFEDYNITEVHFRKQSVVFYFNGSCLVEDNLKDDCRKLDYGWVMNLEYRVEKLEDLDVINRLMDSSVFYRAKQNEEKDKSGKKKV